MGAEAIKVKTVPGEEEARELRARVWEGSRMWVLRPVGQTRGLAEETATRELTCAWKKGRGLPSEVRRWQQQWWFILLALYSNVGPLGRKQGEGLAGGQEDIRPLPGQGRAGVAGSRDQGTLQGDEILRVSNENENKPEA